MTSKEISSLKKAIETALRAAMAKSLATKLYVAVEHPLFAGYKLGCSLGYQKPSIHPTKFIRLKAPDGCKIWSTTASYIAGCAGNVARRGAVEDTTTFPRLDRRPLWEVKAEEEAIALVESAMEVAS